VAGLMKVFKIKGVIPHLVQGGAVERLLTNFEFDDEDDATDEYYSINAAAHARNVEFEKNRSSEVL
jgi:hypothetical protein